MRAAFALLLVAGTARAECWDYLHTEEIAGVAKDGSFVLRTTEFTSAGGGRRTEIEFADAKGLSTGTLFHCEGGEECGKEGWSAKGSTTLPSGNPTPDQFLATQALTPVVKAPGAPRVVFVSEMEEEQAILLGKETLAVTRSPIGEETQEYKKGKPEVLTHAATPFRFVRLSFKDSCSHDGHVERSVTSRVILVPPETPKAIALTAEAVRLLDKDKPAPAADKLRQAVALDPSYVRARARLAQALAATKADWKTARAALDVPRPKRVRTSCIGKEDALPTDEWPELYEFWRKLMMRLGCD